MPGVQARRRCPDAVFLPGDHARYADVSRSVHDILASVTPVIEPIALDEAFLDVTAAQRRAGTAEAIAAHLRTRIATELGLGASVGVATSKLIAKLASEAAKPRALPDGVRPGRGVVAVAPGDEMGFLHPHPVEALWGVGPVTLGRLRALGVRTVGDLAALPVSVLVSTLGRASGQHLHDLAHARDDRPVEADRAVKSVGQEETFATDRTTYDECVRELVRLSDATASRLRAAGVVARTITVKVRFADFRTITRSSTSAQPVASGAVIAKTACALVAAVDVAAGVRLLGVTASGLVAPEAAPQQLSLDDVGAEHGQPGAAWEAASAAVDDVRRRFGTTAIGPAASVGESGLRVRERGDGAWGPSGGHDGAAGAPRSAHDGQSPYR
jgi:DNA polymerase-4